MVMPTCDGENERHHAESSDSELIRAIFARLAVWLIPMHALFAAIHLHGLISEALWCSSEVQKLQRMLPKPELRLGETSTI